MRGRSGKEFAPAPGRAGAARPRPRAAVRKWVPDDDRSERPDHAALRTLQQTAGNKAVVSLVAATLQRTPSGAPPVLNIPAAHANTLPGATAQPRGSTTTAVAVSDAEVREVYARDPGRVRRSWQDNWHAQMYSLDRGAGPVPTAFRIGNLILVHPTYQGMASEMPDWTKDTKPIIVAAQPAAVESAPAKVAPPRDVTPGPNGTMVSSGPEPAGKKANRQPRAWKRPDSWATAFPARRNEVEAAYKKDPSTVVRSNTLAFHEFIWRQDQGVGKNVPRSYRIGGRFYVAPNWVGSATPLPDHSVPRVDPTKVVALPGTTHHTGGRVRNSTTAVTESASGQTRMTTRKRELGTATVTEEESSGGVTRKNERYTAVGKGGKPGVAWGKTESVSPDSETSSTKSSHGSAKVAIVDPKLTVGQTWGKERVEGTDDSGSLRNPVRQVKTGTTTGAAGELGADGAGGSLTRTNTRATGTKSSTSGGGKLDLDGNSSANITKGIESKGGHGASVSGGTQHKVSAEAPEKLSSGVWEVRYTVQDTRSAGVNVSAKGPGMIGAGAGASRSSGTARTGSRQFTSEAAAKAFQKNVAKHVDGLAALMEKSPTTVAGALSIPIGEARGTASSSGRSVNASVSLGASAGRTESTSSSQEVSVRRTGDKTVEVTRTVSSSDVGDWGISGLGLTNEKGSSRSQMFEVTYTFDLRQTGDKRAFEALCQSGAPPGRPPKRTVKLTSAQDHDDVGFLGGKASWKGGTSERVTTDETGKREDYSGHQSHDQDPGWVLKNIFGEDTMHSKAEMVRSQANDKDAGAKAVFTLSGDSGANNREEFAKIFGTAGMTGKARASGNWTLSAEVPREAVKRLEAVHREMGRAANLDEKMRIYARLVKENGAAMLGGQVGMSSERWSLELKGDPNFPGEAGRRRLDALAKESLVKLKREPAAATTMAAQLDTELAALAKRQKEVGDPNKYTDLPGRLRKQQLTVIARHIENLSRVRREAQTVSALHGGDAGAARSTNKDPATATLEREMADKSRAAAALSAESQEGLRALGAVLKSGQVVVADDIDEASEKMHTSHALENIRDADSASFRAKTRIALVDEHRDRWLAATTPTDKRAALAAANAALDEVIKFRREEVKLVQAAANWLDPIVADSAKAKHAGYWGKVRAASFAAAFPQKKAAATK